MGFMAPRNFDEGRYHLLLAYLNRNRVGLGGKNEQARIDAQMVGFREGIAEALAIELSVGRSQMYPTARFAEAINGWEVLEVLESARRNGLGDEQNWTDVVHNKDDKQNFLSKLSEKLDSMVEDKALEAEVTEKRREAILKGEIDKNELTEEDREWLQEKVEEQRTLSAKIFSILGVDDK